MRSLARASLAAAGFIGVAIVFSWPLVLHLGSGLPGPVSGDTGIYVWNLWRFRHEILEHGRLPYFTAEVLSLTGTTNLTFHNSTVAAALAAFPLIPITGVVAAFN